VDVIFESLFFIVVFSFPGAFVRWLVSRLWRSKKTLKEFLNDDFERNGLLTVLIIAVVFSLFQFKHEISYSLLGHAKLVDYYYVYDILDRHPNGELTSGRQVLMCKLGNENDPLIENISFVEWNDERMIIQTDSEYFSIEANEYGLKCSCNNELKGPMTLPEVQEYKVRTGFEPTDDLKTKN
jgi:hypothetical protein